MYCESCGSVIEPEARFCSACGAANLKCVANAVPQETSEAPAYPNNQSSTGAVNTEEQYQTYEFEDVVAQPNSQANGQQNCMQTAPSYNQQDYYYQQAQQPYQTAAATAACPYPRSDNATTLLLVAFILNIIACLAWAVTLIGLAWAIPMTVHSYGIYKGKKPNTVAFGVCTLLFMGLLSGILMLIVDKDTK